MSQQGIRGFYQLTETIKTQLLSDENVNIVTTGDITDLFRGNDNQHDVLNTQLAVLNKLVMVLRKGDLYTTKYQLDGDPTCEPFFDRFENQLAGWACTMDILIENDITICS